jgi:serine protease
VDYANDGNGRDADPSDPGDWVTAADKTALPALYSFCDVAPSSWHGTFIAGQIAAVANNSAGITGINWGGQVLPVRVSGKCGALLSDILDGMRWAAGLSVVGVPANPNPARVINLSFGGDTACSRSYQDVIDEIGKAGSLLVVAAGNSSGPLTRPADCAGVLAVGAAQADGAKTYYSDFGGNVALLAPGGDPNLASLRIYSTTNNGTQGPAADTYGYKLGTSFAAPLAAAVASLMLSVDSTLTPAQLIERLKGSARPHVSNTSYPQCAPGISVACACTTSTCGAGLLDANAALASLSTPLATTASASVTASGGGGASGVWWSVGLWCLALAGLWLRRPGPARL